jgi:hypothetical protein
LHERSEQVGENRWERTGEIALAREREREHLGKSAKVIDRSIDEFAQRKVLLRILLWKGGVRKVETPAGIWTRRRH